MIAQYVTCPKDHKVYVVWVPDKQRFGFTCDECEEISGTAISVAGQIRIQVIEPETKQ
jgi:REP element-mobilizing transposase RayT